MPDQDLEKWLGDHVPGATPSELDERILAAGREWLEENPNSRRSDRGIRIVRG